MHQRMKFVAALSSLLLLASSAASASAESESSSWRPDLPWADLESQLASPATSLLDTSHADFIDQCTSEFLDNPDPFERTNHRLIEQPSGLCMSTMFCAYVGCDPMPNPSPSTGMGTSATRTLADRIAALNPGPEGPSDEAIGWALDPANPSFNLPSKVLFPADATDVVAAVNFARTNGLELSVKNSGHSYLGASTKRDTLLVNMMQFPRYATTSITDCTTTSTGSSTASTGTASLSDDFDDQPCTLAVARGKPAYVRVGGGENFDKLYRAVRAFNDEADGEGRGFQYTVLGGGAGTVSPMGWTFQTGLAGTTGGRMWGFGADQVLQIEMVLPNGQHVRFGPTEWESAEGYTAPRTTAVTGVCRANPEERDEGKWTWSACPADANINFDDLWFAVNGGGGGTWGVITSLYLQLHEYRPLQMVLALHQGMAITLLGEYYPDVKAILPSDHKCPTGDDMDELLTDFILKYRLYPEQLSVPQEDSDICGGPGPGSPYMMYCYDGQALDIVKTAWLSYLEGRNITIAGAEDCIIALPLKDYSDWLPLSNPVPLTGKYKGKVQDGPAPSFTSQEDTGMNIVVPKEFLLFVQEEFKPLIGAHYFAFGSGTKVMSDQANSVPESHRNGATMMFWDFGDSFWEDVFPFMYDTTDKTNFPGFIGPNHASLVKSGPMKDDWTKACPLEWTMEERAKKCIPLQEIIWGTKTLSRLEAIKREVDPTGVFNCQGCVGNNWAIPDAEADADAGADTEVSTPSGGNSPASAALPRTYRSTGLELLLVAVLSIKFIGW